MRRVALLALAMVLAACGGDSSSPTTTGGTDTTGGSVTTGGGATATTTTTAVESPLASEVGLESMVLLTPTEGVGERPDFAWEPVAGAVRYQVTVLTADGALYWAWSGEETSVPLGGFPKLVDGAAGPRVVSGMTWTVVAFDGDMIPLAVGGPASLSR